MIKTISLAGAMLLSGSLAAQDEIFSENGQFGEGTSGNRHVIEVEAGMTIEVVVIGEGVDTTLNATLPGGETLYNDDYEGLNAGFLRTMSSSGSLEITAAPLSSGQTGSYRVVARTMAAPESIAIGQTIEGRLRSGSGDRYELRGRAGQRVAIDLKSYDFDAYLTAIDANGNETTDDDGGDEGYNSRLHYRFASDGTLTIAASSLNAEEGRYQLIVSELSNQVSDRFSGSLTASSPRGYDGTRLERHSFEGQAGQTLTVMLDSQAFDPVLYISGPDGSNLARDDDGGEGNNSLAVVNLAEDGTYTLYVTGFGDSTGSYEVSIYR